VVMDGRDIGTVVFPEAEIKLFLTADAEVRAQRRYQELINKGLEVALEQVRHNIRERDRIDSTRQDSPLKAAEDALVFDNSKVGIDEQLDHIIRIIKEKRP